MSSLKDITYFPAGDAALIIKLGSSISIDTHDHVMAFLYTIKQQRFPFIEALIPSYNEILLQYDPMSIEFDQLLRTLKDLESQVHSRPPDNETIIEIPVVYGGEFGPDISYVGVRTGLDEEQIIEIHSAQTYKVFAVGFLPGFCYLGDLDNRLHVQRKTTPTLKVAAGSIGIGSHQTGIYPLESPGGWQIIGRTPLKLFDIQRASPFLCSTGDFVKFKRISEDEFRHFN